MTTKEFYSKAIALIKHGNIEQSIKVVDTLPFNLFLDFILYCKNKQLEFFNTILFWQNLSQSAHFNDFAKHCNSYLFISSIFKPGCDYNLFSDFIEKLIEISPGNLVKSIRVSKSFMYNGWFDLFEQKFKNHPNSYLRDHFTSFKVLKQQENKLWHHVDKKSSCIKSFNDSPLDLLNELSLWYEVNTNFLNNGQVQHNVAVLNLAIEYLTINGFLEIDESITKEQIIESGIKSISKLQSFEHNQKRMPVFEWLDQINKWYGFVDKYLQVYCFDLNFEPEISNEEIAYLKPVKIEQLVNRRNNGIKINMMFDYYTQVAENMHSEAKRNNQIKGQSDKSISEEDANYIDIQRLSAEQAWLNTFLDEKFEVNKTQYSILNVSKFFSEYSGNNYFRWFKPLIQKQAISNILECEDLMQVFFENLNNKRDIKWLRHDSYNRINEKIAYQRNEINSETILNLFINQPKQEKQFNRFQIKNNLFTKPFLKYGDHLFSFTSIFANTRHYTFLFDNILNQNKDCILINQLSDKFENRISYEFYSKGFQTLLMINKSGLVAISETSENKKFSNKISGESGDIDTLAYKNGCLFIIEAKLAPLRVTMQDTHHEIHNAFTKGASQLSKIIRYIEDDFNNIKNKLDIKEQTFNEIKIFSLIISTSLETDHELICWGDKHFLKISWHELFLILQKEACPEKIMEIIKKNEVWNQLNVLPIPSITETMTSLLFSNFDNEDCSANLFEKAKELLKQQDYYEALNLIEKALGKDESFVGYHLLKAYCLSAIKDYSSAKKCYEKAIDIDPTFIKSYIHFGVFLTNNNKIAEAYSVIKKAIYLNPLDKDSQEHFKKVCAFANKNEIKTSEEIRNEWILIEESIEKINMINSLNIFS